MIQLDEELFFSSKINLYSHWIFSFSKFQESYLYCSIFLLLKHRNKILSGAIRNQIKNNIATAILPGTRPEIIKMSPIIRILESLIQFD